MIQETESRAAAVGLCCMHNAPVRCLLGFLLQGSAEPLDS